MTLSRYVPVTVSRSEPSVSQAGFGTLLSVFQIDVGTLAARYTSFSTPAELAASSMPQRVKDAGAVFFSQNPNAGTFRVGRQVPGTAQVDTVTITTADAGTWSFDVDGTTVSYTAGALDTEQDIAEGLVADFDLKGFDITASTPVGGVFTITANVAGVAFVADSFVAPGAGAGSVANTTANVAAEDISDALDAIEAANADFYGVTIEVRDDTAILDVAAWVETRRKIFVAQTDDATLRSATAGNIAAQLVALSRKRTFVIYNEDDREFSDVAWMSRCLAFRLDIEKGLWAHKTLASVTSSNSDLALTPLTSAEQTNIEDERGNTYTTTAGVNITFPGRNTGTGTSALYFDQVTTEDITVARLQEAIFGALVGDPLGLPMTLRGAAQIEGAMRGVGTQLTAAGHYAPNSVTVSVPNPADLTSAQRATRNLPNCVFTYQESGGIHTVTLSVTIST